MIRNVYDLSEESADAELYRACDWKHFEQKDETVKCPPQKLRLTVNPQWFQLQMSQYKWVSR